MSKRIEEFILNKSTFLKFLNLGLRGVGILSRFLLTFLITKKISLDFQGEYTLLVSTVTILIMFFGFDFYVYSGRLIIKNNKKSVFYLKNMLVFFCFSYILLFFVLCIGYQISSFFKPSFLVVFFLIIFEHLGQEFFRLYLALKKPLLANILLFVRTGLWAFLIVLCLLFVDEFSLTITSIIKLWLLCAFVTSVLGFAFFPEIKTFFKAKIDFFWIKKGIKVGLTMFSATICLKIIEYSDRYLIAFFLDNTEVGIYAFYYQIASIVNVVIFTMYISFLYPDIVKGIYNEAYSEVRKTQKEIKQKTLLIAFMFGVLFLFFSSDLLAYVNRIELEEKRGLYYILLCSTIFLNFSFTSHYVLIAKEKENLVFTSTVIACISNILLNVSLIPFIGVYGAAIALLISNIIIFILKRRFEKKLLNA